MNGLDRILRPLAQRVANMIGRGVVQAVDDGQGIQVVQISMLADELRGQVERFQNYGFTAHPHPGAEVAFACVAGSRDHVLVVAIDDRRYRLQALEQGEVALYTDEGDKVVLKRGREIHVTAGTKVVLDTPLVEATHDLHVLGNVEVDGNSTVHGDEVVDGDIDAAGTITGATDVVGGGKSLKGHKHISVTPGSGVSGIPQ